MGSAEQPLYCRCRVQLENLVKRRFFIAPSFEIYGGVAGLYDFGPPGCALKAEVESLWRQHFILSENMLEISGPCLTPYSVLKTSGHVDRFTDLMVKDVVTQDCFRADKYLEDVIDKKLNPPPPSAKSKDLTVELSDTEKKRLEMLRRQADSLSSEDLHQIFEDLGIKSPDGNELTKPFPFNLMFGTKIGPKQEEDDCSAESGGGVNGMSLKGRNEKEQVGSGTAFLRPETAQGIFVNFRRLLEYNGGKMPFAAAQMGLGFRNEIAPRNGLLRVREFQMAEIEHFVHPDQKDHPKFKQVKDLCLPLFSRDQQNDPDGQVQTHITIEEAVKTNLIDNETLGYFLARTYLFLLKCGIQGEGLRFRQHLSTEMAHYAKDCWDAEIRCSYGWIEVVGHADRSAFDLSHHSKESKVDLMASFRYDKPKTVEFAQYIPDKKEMGKQFKKAQADVHAAITEMTDEQKMQLDATLTDHGFYDLKLGTGESFKITREMMTFSWQQKTISEESYVPAVIEPSFGIGRLIHCILEHSFRSRGIEEQEERCYLSVPPCIAAVKCSVLPISNNTVFDPIVDDLRDRFTQKGLANKSDTTGASIGRRYARTDEIGIPFGITVDFQSAKDRTVTLRERDSMKQVRMQIPEAVDAVADMVADRLTWENVLTKFPLFVEQEVKE
eukprot:GHVQ01024833.1.p1 GENE.GHVQ01024833.1~~GHVQ01024833.1.p1  ORF type:complete len:667 (+),score=90.06 GHVQ01024833.1:86-2086(+)